MQQPPDPPSVEDSHYGTPPPPSPQQYAPETGLDRDQRTWAMLAHLAVFSGYVIPLGNIIGPLVVWLIKREEYPTVDFHGKEALNFQISVIIYFLICIPLMFIVIGFFLAAAVAITSIVCTIIAAIKAHNGEYYRYPLTIRFIN